MLSVRALVHPIVCLWFSQELTERGSTLSHFTDEKTGLETQRPLVVLRLSLKNT